MRLTLAVGILASLLLLFFPFCLKSLIVLVFYHKLPLNPAFDVKTGLTGIKSASHKSEASAFFSSNVKAQRGSVLLFCCDFSYQSCLYHVLHGPTGPTQMALNALGFPVALGCGSLF